MATIDLGRIKFKWQGAWSSSTAYVVDDVVESGGSSYVCILASTNNAPPNATYWELMADGGSPTTTQGDIIVRGASNDGRLAIGTAGQALKVNSSANGLEYGVAGGIVQVKAVEKTDTQSFQTTNETEITNLNVSITPTSASNKILVIGQLWSSSNTNTVTAFNALKRSINSGTYTTIGNHSSDGSNNTKATGHGGTFSGSWNLMNTSVSFLDNPNTTDAINYKWYFRSEDATQPTFINRTGRNSTVYHPRLNSTITLMEIDSGVL